METQANAKTLADALAILRRYAGKGNGTKASETVELRTHDDGNTLTLRRFAARTWTDVTANVHARTFGHGTAYVPADALADALKGAKGDARITLADDRLTVETETGTATLAAPAFSDFPDAPAFPWTTLADVPPSKVRVLRSVTKIAGGYDARAVLTGVYFDAENGRAVSTDTYRMHVANLPGIKRSAIIPADVLGIALATTGGSVSVGIGSDDDTRYFVTYTAEKGPKASRRVVFVTVAGRTIEGPFPNYDAIVRPAFADAVTSWELRDAAGTATILRNFKNGKNVPAILTAAGSAVRVTAAFGPGDTREAVAPIAAPSDPFDGGGIAFNPAYAADAVEHAGDGAPVFLRDGLRAAVFGSEDADAYALLMPMRVS